MSNSLEILVFIILTQEEEEGRTFVWNNGILFAENWQICKSQCRLLPGCSHYTWDNRNSLCSKIKWAFSDAMEMELLDNTYVTILISEIYTIKGNIFERVSSTFTFFLELKQR